MRLDGFPWTQYGTVSARVSQVATEIRDNLLRVEFTPEPSTATEITLQHGLPGTIDVSVEQVTPALLILRSAGQLLQNATVKMQPALPVPQS
jgi:membrane fusion protein (multidrug efflux system)